MRCALSSIASMSSVQTPPSNLRSVLRAMPALCPEDSVARCIHVMRLHGTSGLPVVDHLKLVGAVEQGDLLPLLAAEGGPEREAALHAPVETIMRSPRSEIPWCASQAEAAVRCLDAGASWAPVVAEDGAYLGVIQAADLLMPDHGPVRPQRIGGMATPFGVYLTDGGIQAGASNLALMATGAALGLLFLAAATAVSTAAYLAERYAGMPAWPALDPDYAPSSHDPAQGLLWVGIHLALFLVFLTLMRFTRIARYHAAEHQAVHAVERGEPLVAQVVRRMPRAHPRCGTNLMAAVSLFLMFGEVLQFAQAVAWETAAIFAGLATLLSWRPVGTFLQERFTTRTARDKEIASGISAAHELISKYQTSLPGRPGVVRRLWCMGLAQTAAGMFATFGIVCGLLWLKDLVHW